MSSCKNFSFVCTFIAKGRFFDEHVYFVCTKITTEISFLYFLAGENVISNWETEIAKALWNRGIYRRALDCFQMLKLKSGGFIASETGNECAKGFFLHIPLQHITHNVTDVKLIVTRTHDWITTGKSRIIISRWLYSYETNYRDSVRCRSKPVHSSRSHWRGRNYLHIVVGDINQVWLDQCSLLLAVAVKLWNEALKIFFSLEKE